MTVQPFIIRRAEITDAETLRVLAVESFVHAYAAYNTESDMQNYLASNFSIEKIEEELADEQLVFLLAYEGNRLTGYVKLNRSIGARGGADNPLEISRLYTAPSQIGRGIGKKILQAAEEFARANGCDALCLDVWQKNYRAVNFYQREGFSICGLTQFRLGDDIQDDFVMIRRIAR